MSEITNILSQINNYANNDAKKLVEASELRYDTTLDSIASRIPRFKENMVVMLAGPSSSGKTTTAKKLISRFNANGISAYRVSLDDFYLEEGSAPLSDDGTPDFETVYALDLPLLTRTISNILSVGESDMPIFNFNTRRRNENPFHLSLNDGDIVIFEGLHALNPIITDQFPQDRLFKLYVSVSTRIYDDDGEVVLSKRDLRLIRRTVRDYKHRSSTAYYTFDTWSSVINGENEYLFPFEDRADVKLNSFFPYEPCVIKNEAIDILGQVQENSEHYKKSQSLINNLKKFVVLPQSVMPDNSLLREFSGF